MKFKMMSIVMAAVMAAGMLTGCGPTEKKDEVSTMESDTNKTDVQASGSDQKPVTLRFSWWGGDSRNEATMKVIENFEAEYPWITIEPEYGGSDGYHDKLATQLSSGTEPDIMQVDPETMPQFVKNGDYFVDYLTTDFDFTYFDMDSIQGSTITGSYDGKQYGLPTGVAGPCVVVNKKLADEVGINFADSYSWDDLLTWGQTVKENNPDAYLLSTNVSYLNNMVVNYYMKQLTGNTLFDKESGKLLADEKNLTKTFEYIKALFDHQVVCPIEIMVQYDGDNLQSDPNWIAGNYVSTFSYISTAEVMTAANESTTYYAGELPNMEGKVNDGWIVGCPQILVTSKNSANVEACILFLNYFYNNDEALSVLSTQRSVPPTEHAREIVQNDGNLSEILSDSVDILTPYAGLANDPIGSSAEAKQIMCDAITEVAYGQMSPAEAAQDVIMQYQGIEK